MNLEKNILKFFQKRNGNWQPEILFLNNIKSKATRLTPEFSIIFWKIPGDNKSYGIFQFPWLREASTFLSRFISYHFFNYGPIFENCGSNSLLLFYQWIQNTNKYFWQRKGLFIWIKHDIGLITAYNCTYNCFYTEKWIPGSQHVRTHIGDYFKLSYAKIGTWTEGSFLISFLEFEIRKTPVSSLILQIICYLF